VTNALLSHLFSGAAGIVSAVAYSGQRGAQAQQLNALRLEHYGAQFGQQNLSVIERQQLFNDARGRQLDMAAATQFINPQDHWIGTLRHIERQHNARQMSGVYAKKQMELLLEDLVRALPSQKKQSDLDVSFRDLQRSLVKVFRPKQERSKWLKLQVWLISKLSGQSPFQVYWEKKHGD